MRFVYYPIEHIFCFNEGTANELVIENKKMFREILCDLAEQTEGKSGNAVLSIKDTPVEICKHAEIIEKFIPFDINTKTLVGCLCKAIEKEAVRDENFAKTSELLALAEKYLYDICLDFPCEISFSKLNIGAIVKAVSPQFDDTDKPTLEKLLDYMSLVREFDREKLFILINLRCYYDDNDMNKFIKTAISHDFKLLLLESTAFTPLQNVVRVIIDEDLCEI